MTSSKHRGDKMPEELNSILVELHSHSNYSDGSASPEKLFMQANKIGLEALAITDHNIFACGKMKELEKKYNIINIPGVEINSDAGHILCLGINSMPRSKTLPELHDEIHSDSGILIAAHPYGGALREGIVQKPEYVKYVDAIEVLNGKTFASMNKKAMELAVHCKKPMVSGSDSHILSELGKYACKIDGSSVEEILKAIKKGHVILPDKKTSFTGILWKTFKGKVRKQFR